MTSNMIKIPDSKYIQINLSDIIKGIGEDRTKEILSSFSCPLNKDVENFFKNKAIEFSKRDFAKTHLVFWCPEDASQKELVGYYTIAPKSFFISKDIISKSLYKKISQYGEYDPIQGKCSIPSMLIGQLGKNYNMGNDGLIKGSELLQMAQNKVRAIQNEMGGRYVYLECEDKEKLLAFYQYNGFILFGKRSLDKDETDIEGSYLMQLLKKLD